MLFLVHVNCTYHATRDVLLITIIFHNHEVYNLGSFILHAPKQYHKPVPLLWTDVHAWLYLQEWIHRALLGEYFHVHSQDQSQSHDNLTTMVMWNNGHSSSTVLCRENFATWSWGLTNGSLGLTREQFHKLFAKWFANPICMVVLWQCG